MSDHMAGLLVSLPEWHHLFGSKRLSAAHLLPLDSSWLQTVIIIIDS